MTTKKLLTLILVTTLLCLSGTGCIDKAFNKGPGSSVDTIHGVEYSGYFFKTYKIYLTHDQGLMGPNNKPKFDGTYTVDKNNTEVVQKLYAAKASQQKVNITYEEYGWTNPFEYEGTTIITDVLPVNETAS